MARYSILTENIELMKSKFQNKIRDITACNKKLQRQIKRMHSNTRSYFQKLSIWISISQMARYMYKIFQ